MKSRHYFVAAAAAFSLAACNSASEKPDANDSMPAEAAGSLKGPSSGDTTGGMAGMKGMESGMGGMMTGMMDSMQTHMRMMDTMTAARMKAMLPAHRQMAAKMLSGMSADMRGMNMTADAVWTATADSLRQDLVNMPEMSPAQLKSVMPAHHARMTRLTAMHRDMMAKMKD